LAAVLCSDCSTTCHWRVVEKIYDINNVLIVGDLYIFCCIDCFVKDYNDHISEISNKLVAIMDSMLEMNISKVWLSYLYKNYSGLLLVSCAQRAFM